MRNRAVSVDILVGFNGLAHVLLGCLETIPQDETQHCFPCAPCELGELRDAALLC
jgi:hypothetical protein